MKRILITGGHRAGKTTKALKLAEAYPKKLYLATAEAFDEEMTEKIEKHKAERDESFVTFEEPIKLAQALKQAPRSDLIIVDCLTVWINNLIHYGKDVQSALDGLFTILPEIKTDIIFVTNESSFCLIPPDSVSRKYLLFLAETNRQVASLADEVWLMISGLGTRLK